MGRRSRGSGLVYMGLFAVLLAFTSVRALHPTLVAVFGGAIVVISLIRSWLAFAQSRYYPDRRAEWQLIFKIAALLGAAIWGAFISSLFHLDGPSSSAVYALLAGMGISAGATTSMSLDLKLIRAFLALIIVPVMIFTFEQRGGGQITPIPFFSVLFFGFLWVQSGMYHREYWRSLKTRELARSQRDQLQAILDAIPGYVAWIDSHGQFVGMNRRTSEVSSVLLSHEEFTRKICEFMKSQEKQNLSELQLPFPSGLRWTLLGICKYISNKKTEGIIIGLDIEDRKSAEQRLEVARMNAQYASKMKMLGEMAGGMGHEINNPLTVIQLGLEELKVAVQRGGLDPKSLLTTVNYIEVQGNRIAKIITSVRAFARDDAGESLGNVKLNKVVEDTLGLCRSKFESSGVTIEVGYCSADPMIECRANQISQVLLNLLNNSIEATESLLERWVTVNLADKGDWIELSVTDSGKGIPQETSERIFDPFFTTKDIGKGTGLGLSVSKGIIESHGGTITTDRASANTMFVVRMPKRQLVTQPKAA